MASFTGQFEYVDGKGAPAGTGPCQVSFDRETVAITPARGGPLVFDLGDVDSLGSADCQLTVRLYTGATVVLRALGKAFATVDRDLRAARRDRFVKCLLLSDLEERDRYEGTALVPAADRAVPGPAELRLYESNIAVLPDAAAGIQWRLADVDDVRFDAARYAVEVRAGRDTLTVSKLGKRTEEFQQRLQQAMADVAARCGRALLAMLPFLSPDQLLRVVSMMREGRTVAVADLAAVDARIEAALLGPAVGPSLKPYVDALVQRAVPGSHRIGFKLLGADRPPREDEGGPGPLGESSPEPDVPFGRAAQQTAEGETPVVFWTFVRLAGKGAAARPDFLAWEATIGSGRATYFFRLSAADAEPGVGSAGPPSPDAEIELLNRALVSLNFRREPIYLDDGALARTPGYRRYLIAARRLPELRRLRAAFAGRAIHTSLERWQADVDAIVNRP